MALSSAEAKYVVLSSAVQEAIWLKHLIVELRQGNGQTEATVIYEDNQVTISLAKNLQYHGQAKHIDIRHHFVRESCGGDHQA